MQHPKTAQQIYVLVDSRTAALVLAAQFVCGFGTEAFRQKLSLIVLKKCFAPK